MAKGVHPGAPVPATWAEIATMFGDSVVEDVKRVVVANVGGKEITGHGLAFRHFLKWLQEDASIQCGDPASVLVIGDGASRTSAQALAVIVEAWKDDLARTGRFSPMTQGGYVRRVVSVLSWLSALPDRRYAKFDVRFIRVRRGSGYVKTLGTLGWPEVDGLVGAARERRALDLVASSCMEAFDRFERVFEFGRRLMSESSPRDGADHDGTWHTTLFGSRPSRNVP